MPAAPGHAGNARSTAACAVPNPELRCDAGHVPGIPQGRRSAASAHPVVRNRKAALQICMTGAYYNDNDKEKCAWLRELIKAGAIAQGDVDERNLEDVDPAELVGYTQCHFFAGIGAWSYALRLAGWPDDRPVWTGSCPCPSFSCAGKGQGFDEPRHQWPHWARLIRERKPPVIFGEQADDAIGFGWLDLVQTDLEAEAYAVGKAVLGAASVGASDIRQRLYFVAHCLQCGRIPQSRGAGEEGASGIQSRHHAGRRRGVHVLADARCGGGELLRLGVGSAPRGSEGEGDKRERLRLDDRDGESTGVMADAESPGTTRLGADGREESTTRGLWSRPSDGSELGLLDDAAGARHDREIPGTEGDSRHEARLCVPSEGFGPRELGIASVERREGIENGRSDVHGSGRTTAKRAGSQLTGPVEGRAWASPLKGFWRDADWLFCRDGKWRPVEPGTFPLAHGAPARLGRLRGYGDAINAYTAKAFIEAVMDT